MVQAPERVTELPPDLAPWDPEAYQVGLKGYADGQSILSVCWSPDVRWRRWCTVGWLDAQRVARLRGGAQMPTAVVRALDDGEIPLGGV